LLTVGLLRLLAVRLLRLLAVRLLRLLAVGLLRLLAVGLLRVGSGRRRLRIAHSDDLFRALAPRHCRDRRRPRGRPVTEKP